MKALIFDLYDTLVTITNKTSPYSYLLKHLNDTNEKYSVVTNIMTKDVDVLEFCNQLLDTNILNDAFEYKMFSDLLNSEIDSVILLPETEEVLKRLKQKYRLFLLSNLSTPYKNPFYKLNLSDYFEKAFFSCECGDKKPNSTFYKKVVDYSGLNKEDFIMIGDNPISDFKGANDFGIQAILKDSLIKELTKNL